MVEEKSKLKELKKKYSELEKKFKLASFEKMNADFFIEGIDHETDFLIREVRKFVSEKLNNYLRFCEGLLNPSNVPMFVYSIIKGLSVEDKNRISEIYKELAVKELELITLDLVFDEKKEAKFIKDFFELWQEKKKELAEIIENIRANSGNKSEFSRGYFG